MIPVAPRSLTLTAARPDPGLLDLPWSTPLKDWPADRLAALPRGISRHVVRFAHLSGGIVAVNLRDGDELVGAVLCSAEDDLLLVSANGQSIRFSATDEAQKPDSGVVHHVAFASQGFDGMRKRLQSKGMEFHSRQVPGGDLWQIFVNDPNGVMIELNYEAAKEGGAAASASPVRMR